MHNRVLFSVGSNLGNKKQNIINSITYLQNIGVSELIISSYYLTEPVGNKEQEYFLNIAAVGHTKLSSNILLFLCKSIEYSVGRRLSKKWSERVLDIDIVIFGELIINSKNLTIPHTQFRQRKFVLVPASEIDEKLMDPVSNKNIRDLLQECTDTSQISIYKKL